MLENKKEILRKIPSVDRLLKSPDLSEIISKYPRNLILKGIHQVLDGIRQGIEAGDGLKDSAELAQRVKDGLDSRITVKGKIKQPERKEISGEEIRFDIYLNTYTVEP